MKRLLPAVALVLLLLTGCQLNGKTKVQPLPTDFKAEVEIKTNYGSYKALLEHSFAYTRLIYSQPEIINGLTLTKTANGCTAELAGLTVSSDENYFTGLSAVNLIDEVLKAVLYTDGEALETTEFDERIIIKGMLREIPFELVRYKDYPKILSISIPSCAVEVIFT
jgi:hypothetical protein